MLTRRLRASKDRIALTFDADFAIEHVYGHHRRLATTADPATARRGEHFYAFVARSVIGRVTSPAGGSSLRPPNSPAMMRMPAI